MSISDKPLRVYIAGPMSGIPDYNFPEFARITKKYRDMGHTVFSPAENDFLRYGKDFLEHPERFDLRRTISDDCRWLIEFADVIVVLPDWKLSKGVAVERALANFLGLKFIYE